MICLTKHNIWRKAGLRQRQNHHKRTMFTGCIASQKMGILYRISPPYNDFGPWQSKKQQRFLPFPVHQELTNHHKLSSHPQQSQCIGGSRSGCAVDVVVKLSSFTTGLCLVCFIFFNRLYVCYRHFSQC